MVESDHGKRPRLPISPMTTMADIQRDILRDLAAMAGVTLSVDQKHRDNLMHTRLENWGRSRRGHENLGYQQIQPWSPGETAAVEQDADEVERALLTLCRPKAPRRHRRLYRCAKATYIHRLSDLAAAEQVLRRRDEDAYRAELVKLWRLLWHVLEG